MSIGNNKRNGQFYLNFVPVIQNIKLGYFKKWYSIVSVIQNLDTLKLTRFFYYLRNGNQVSKF